MGTNFYLRRVRPREVHDLYHVGKRSYGWKPSFEAYTPYSEGWGLSEVEGDEDPRPAVHSIDDIECLLESGEWQLEDEYGQRWAPGEESLEAFRSELLSWDGGQHLDPDFEPRDHGTGHYRDPKGYEFYRGEFR